MYPDVHVYMYIHTYTRDRHESILGIIKTVILPDSQEKICITAFLSEQHPLEADLSRAVLKTKPCVSGADLGVSTLGSRHPWLLASQPEERTHNGL